MHDNGSKSLTHIALLLRLVHLCKKTTHLPHAARINLFQLLDCPALQLLLPLFFLFFPFLFFALSHFVVVFESRALPRHVVGYAAESGRFGLERGDGGEMCR